MSITRTLAAALAIATLAVPAAQAKPTDTGARPFAGIEQLDGMHPSAAQAPQKQDLRSADAREAARHPRSPGHPINAPGATAVDSATRPSRPTPAGPPTWPGHPQPIAQAPVAKVTDGGNGVDWTTIGLGIAGSLLAVSGLAAVNSRRNRRSQRLRVIA